MWWGRGQRSLGSHQVNCYLQARTINLNHAKESPDSERAISQYSLKNCNDNFDHADYMVLPMYMIIQYSFSTRKTISNIWIIQWIQLRQYLTRAFEFGKHYFLAALVKVSICLQMFTYIVYLTEGLLGMIGSVSLGSRSDTGLEKELFLGIASSLCLHSLSCLLSFRIPP